MIQKIAKPLYRFMWSYWLDKDDTVVKVIGIKTALVDRHGQRRKMQPAIWRTLKQTWL